MYTKVIAVAGSHAQHMWSLPVPAYVGEQQEEREDGAKEVCRLVAVPGTWVYIAGNSQVHVTSTTGLGVSRCLCQPTFDHPNSSSQSPIHFS